MPRQRNRKTNRGPSDELMKRAAKLVLEQNLKVRQVARDLDICHVTLHRYIRKIQSGQSPKMGYNPHTRVLSTEKEEAFLKYIQLSAAIYFGLTPKDIRKLMPRTYVKKTDRSNINEKHMRQAIYDTMTKKLSEYEAARQYNIKRTTLPDSGNESENEKETYSNKYTSRQVFTANQELEMKIYIQRCSDLNYGLSYAMIRKLAYEFSKVIPNCKVPENWTTHQTAELNERNVKQSQEKTSCPSLESIRPYPKADNVQKKRSNRRKGKSAVYTDTPELKLRESLEAEKMHKQRQQNLKEKGKRKGPQEKNLKDKGKSTKRKIFDNSSSDSRLELPLEHTDDDEIEEELILEELRPILQHDVIQIGHFVIVKFLVDKKEIFFVAQVLTILDKEYSVKFLRRRGKSNNFAFPAVDDISVVNREDVVFILNYVSKQQGTARSCSYYTFNFNFKDMNMR
ncbi:homeobox-like domain superfamily [Holotrichia oblita]|uniref:Homeobox-like domain superfamily n=1 Tax=Holotrichia oblita TaxID=644536 RepID=A0ACB9TMN1_HOLOL|nr:homeobox-like domain superfamily [Holotrichia oblita]